MRKLSLGLLTILGSTWTYFAYAQNAKETIEKRRIEKAIELGSGDFTITDKIITTDDIGVGGTPSGAFTREVYIGDPSSAGVTVENTTGPAQKYTFGIRSSKEFALYDDTAAAYRLLVETDGDVIVNENMVVLGNVLDGSGNQFNIEPVGTIKQSILSEAQFQSQSGTDWVAMKGQAVAGSTICLTYSICTLPDARNRFLRNSDAADTNLRGLVADTTTKNGLALTGAVASEFLKNLFLASGNVQIE